MIQCNGLSLCGGECRQDRQAFVDERVWHDGIGMPATAAHAPERRFVPYLQALVLSVVKRSQSGSAAADERAAPAFSTGVGAAGDGWVARMSTSCAPRVGFALSS